MKRKSKMLILVIMASILLTGCGKATLLDLSEVQTDPRRAVNGSSTGLGASLTVSVGDVGLFYSQGNLLNFYDTDAKEDYVLCAQANCSHASEKCSAYFTQSVDFTAAESVAQIDGYLYCSHLTTNSSNRTDSKAVHEYQILRIDPSTGERKAVASFPRNPGGIPGHEDDFFASAIGGIDYCNGYAWFDLTMSQPVKAEDDAVSQSYTQVTGVNLETGEVIVLNGFDEYSYGLKLVGSDYVFYSRNRDTVPLLSEADFYALYEQDTGGATIDGKVFVSYYDYWMWQVTEYPDEETLYYYDLSTGEVHELYSGLTTKIGFTQCCLVEVEGEYDGKIMLREYIPEPNGEYVQGRDVKGRRCVLNMWDPSDGSKEVVAELERGSTLYIAQGSRINSFFADGTFFYLDNMNEETADIWRYDANTGISTYLFTDDVAITFRIFGEYNGGYIGKHKDHQANEGFYWISKEDFYTGNPDAMIHYDVG